MTSLNNGDIRLGHGFTHWWTLFNPRQALVQTQLLRAILTMGSYDWETREFVLGAFQQYLRNQSLFTLWNMAADKLEPMFANNNFHPKSTVVENNVFAPLGRGNWRSCNEGIIEGGEWAQEPWEVVSVERLKQSSASWSEGATGKRIKADIGDSVLGAQVEQKSATALSAFGNE
jgi:putative DNA methylase